MSTILTRTLTAQTTLLIHVALRGVTTVAVATQHLLYVWLSCTSLWTI